LCLLSMAVEGAFYASRGGPWPQKAIRRWYLSTPVALWQAWTVRRQRRQRAIARRREHEHLQEALRPQPVMASVQRGEARAATQPNAGERPSAKVLPASQSMECTAFEYAEAVWEGHFLFWNVVSMLTGWVWLVWAEDMGGLAAGVVEGVLWALGSLLLVLPIALALLAGLSGWLVGAGLSPVERWRVVESIRAAEASKARTAAPAPAVKAQPRPASSGWLVPLLLGLWIGSAWGDD
jgi:xanthosine utilization system XapX-like protein